MPSSYTLRVNAIDGSWARLTCVTYAQWTCALLKQQREHSCTELQIPLVSKHLRSPIMLYYLHTAMINLQH